MVSAIGITAHETFPPTKSAARGVMAISVVLVLLAMASAVITGSEVRPGSGVCPRHLEAASIPAAAPLESAQPFADSFANRLAPASPLGLCGPRPR